MRGRGKAAERTDRGRDHRLRTPHPAAAIRLRIDAEGQLVADPAPIEAAERHIVAIDRATPAERSKHPGIEAELAEPFGELRLIEKDVEIEGFGTPGIVRDRETNVVRALGKGKILKVERSRVEFEAPDKLAVDAHFDDRAPLDTKAAVATRTDDPLRVEQRIEARHRQAADFRRRLKATRERLQITARPTHKIVAVVIDKARAAALEICAARAGLPIRFAFEHDSTETRGTVEKGNRRGQSLVAALLHPVHRPADIEIGAEIGGRDIVDGSPRRVVAKRDRPTRPAGGRDLHHQLQRLGVVTNSNADALEVGPRDRTAFGQTRTQPIDEHGREPRRQQREQPFGRKARLPAGFERQCRVAKIGLSVEQRRGQHDGAACRVDRRAVGPRVDDHAGAGVGRALRLAGDWNRRDG